MPKRESCGSALRCGLPLFRPRAAGLRVQCRARHVMVSDSAVVALATSRAALTCNPHSACCQPVPNRPRLRALALFGRRPLQRVVSLVIPATKNLHTTGREELQQSSKFLKLCPGSSCLTASGPELKLEAFRHHSRKMYPDPSRSLGEEPPAAKSVKMTRHGSSVADVIAVQSRSYHDGLMAAPRG